MKVELSGPDEGQRGVESVKNCGGPISNRIQSKLQKTPGEEVHLSSRGMGHRAAAEKLEMKFVVSVAVEIQVKGAVAVESSEWKWKNDDIP